MSDEITQHTLLPEVKEEIAHSFSNGDMVEVIEGEMQILQLVTMVGWCMVATIMSRFSLQCDII